MRLESMYKCFDIPHFLSDMSQGPLGNRPIRLVSRLTFAASHVTMRLVKTKAMSGRVAHLTPFRELPVGGREQETCVKYIRELQR